jgi:hypothetical protein
MTEVRLNSDCLLLEIQKRNFPSSNKQCHSNLCCKTEILPYFYAISTFIRRTRFHNFVLHYHSLQRQSYEGLSTDYIKREISKNVAVLRKHVKYDLFVVDALNSLMSCVYYTLVNILDTKYYKRKRPCQHSDNFLRCEALRTFSTKYHSWNNNRLIMNLCI